MPANKALAVRVALPVPPYVAPMAAAFHLPVVIPPTVVIDVCPEYVAAIDITLLVIVIVVPSAVKAIVLDD